MLLYSELIHHGYAPEPFDSSHAAAFASMILLPDETIGPLAHLPDAQLAERFNVPLAEIARKRLELDALGLSDAPPGPRSHAMAKPRASVAGQAQRRRRRDGERSPALMRR